MNWLIDTSMTGPVPAADLKATLEASRDHFIKTQAEQMADHVVHAATGNADKPGQPKPDYVAIAGKAKAAKDAVLDKLASMRAHMDLGIKQACEQAAAFGGIVAATVEGHDDPMHPSAVGLRMKVAVDKRAAG